MKGIVVENNNKESVVLTEDGLFIKVKNENYEIGQTIRVKNNKKTFSKMVVGVASMAAAFVIFTIGGYAYFTPTDYVSMDVNPSIEYSVNMFDRVLDVKAVNDDGEKILENLNIDNENIVDAIEGTIDKLMTEGYITDDPNSGIIITTSNKDKKQAEKLAAKLDRDIQKYLDSQEGIAAKVDAEAVGLNKVKEARDRGVTPGKLKLVEQLEVVTNGAVDYNIWLEKSVKDINKEIKENKEIEKDNKKDQSNGNGQFKQENPSADVEDSTVTTEGSVIAPCPASGNSQNAKNDKEKANRSDNDKEKTNNSNNHNSNKKDKSVEE